MSRSKDLLGFLAIDACCQGYEFHEGVKMVSILHCISFVYRPAFTKVIPVAASYSDAVGGSFVYLAQCSLGVFSKAST
jgi:hypothetical protein